MSSDHTAPRSHSDWVGIWFGLCVALLAAYQQFKLPPVLPEMLDLYGYGAGMAGGFMSIFAVIGLVLSFQFGRWMSRQATAAWLIGACGLVGLGAIPILTFPENGWAILVGRAFEGTAMAILAIAGPTLMTRLAEHLMPGDQIWSSVWWAGLVFAVLMAGWTLILARQNDGRRIALPSTKGGAPDLSKTDRQALMMLSACFGLWALQNLSVLSWLPEYLVADRGLSTAVSKELYGVTVIAIAGSNLLAAAILKAGFPIARLLTVVLVGQGTVLVIGPYAGTDISGVAILLAYGFFAGITPTCIFGLPGRLLGPDRTGPAAFGLMMTGRNLGLLTGPILVGWVAGSSLGWSAGWWTAAAATGCAVIAALAIQRQVRRADAVAQDLI